MEKEEEQGQGEKRDKNVSVQIPPIMRIPREVRGIIFNKLPQPDILNLRYVCRDWKSEVDDFCEFCVVLDDRKPFLERISQLRIRKCRVIHLPNILPDNLQPFLRYPSLLRSLKIVTENLSPENFYTLVKDSSQHLLEFCAFLPLHTLLYKDYPSDFYLRLDNLVRLRLSISSMPEHMVPVMGPPKFQDNLFCKLVEGSGGSSSAPVMKNLKTLAIAVRCLGFRQVSYFSSLFLSLICRHHKTLEHVDFDMIQGHGMPLSEITPLSESDLERVDMPIFKKVVALESLRVINSTAIGVDMLSQLVAQQRHLRFLETDILPASDQLYKQIILNCQDTIVHVDIGDLTISFEDENSRHFDVSVFQNCLQLRKLTLDRNCLQRRNADDPLTAELINLQSLPEYLEELAINYFLLLSDELIILFSSTPAGNRRRLKSLTLTQCGNSGEFGVDGSVLQKVIAIDDISFIEISPLNFSQPNERLTLNAILTTYGYNEDHQYFQLSKVSHNFQINFDDFVP